MNASASLSTIEAPTLNPLRRMLRSQLETSVPGVYLTITTVHARRAYWSQIGRAEIKGSTMTMSILGNRSDPALLSVRETSAPRYSRSTIEAAHADFIATAVAAQLPEALSWAERL